MDMLDNPSQIAQKDTKNALGMAADEPKQLVMDLVVENTPRTLPTFSQIVVTGMGGSALAAELARDWLDLPLPFIVSKDYVLPHFVGTDTLVIACSFSGNTEETLSAFAEAKERGAHVVIAAGGGALLDAALKEGLPFVHMTYDGVTPRMFMLENLRAFVEILVTYGAVHKQVINELRAVSEHLSDIDGSWGPKVPFEKNYAKQLAWQCAGKTPVMYTGPRFRAIGYKWKISFNESAKNVAFCHEYPEFNHNEFMGWASHPIEKPFAVLDLRSSFDLPQIQRRFELSDRLLSGLRPKATPVELQGDTMLEQMVWGIVLADYVSTYLGILNGVDPAPVPLIEKLKSELAKP